MSRVRAHLSTVLVAMITAMVTAGAPAIGAAVKRALFADNAGKVDGLSAVESNASVAKRKGKLVATNSATGRLPNNIIAKALDSELLDGQDSTGFAAAGHDHDGAYINASPGSPESASIDITGTLATTGLLQTGSGQGTTQGLGPSMVIRRTSSIDSTAGNVLAHAYEIRLERDGTNGGLRFGWSAGADTATNSGSCMGLTSAGTSVGYYNPNLGGVAAGFVQIFTDAQDVVQVECSFGKSANNAFVTHVSLQRSHTSVVWSGYLQADINQ